MAKREVREVELDELVKLAAAAAYDKKGEDICILDLTHLPLYVCDFFLIVTGKTREHLRAMADHIEKVLGDMGAWPGHVEGYEVGRWILLDYGDFVAHLMTEEARSYYGLELLWGDAEQTTYPEEAGEAQEAN